MIWPKKRRRMRKFKVILPDKEVIEVRAAEVSGDPETRSVSFEDKDGNDVAEFYQVIGWQEVVE